MTLGVTELSTKSETATRLAISGDYNSAFTQYVSCVMFACRDLLQARGISSFNSNTNNNNNQQLLLEINQIVDLARYCLEKAHTILKQDISPPSLTSSAATTTRTFSPSPSPSSSPLINNDTTNNSLSASFSTLPPIIMLSPQQIQQQQNQSQQILRPQLGRSRSGNLPDLSNSDPFQTTTTTNLNAFSQAQNVVILPQGLVLVPGIEIDKMHASLLRKLDQNGISKLSEPARELQVLNEFLIRKHQANIAKANSTTSQFNRPSAISDVNLSLFRQQTENTAIARQKQLRLLKEAFDQLTPHPIQTNQTPNQNQNQTTQNQTTQNQNQPNSSSGTSTLLTKFKEIHDKHFTSQATKDRNQIIADGGDEKAVAVNVRRMFSASGHNLNKKLTEFATSFTFQQPMPLEDALDRIKLFQNTLINEICEQLKLDPNGNGCTAVVETVSDVVITQIYPTLFELIKEKSRDKDMKTNSRISALTTLITPAMLGIKRQHWLVPETITNPTQITEVSIQSYQSAITTLQGLTNSKSATAKSKCLVDALSAVPLCVEKFYGNNSNVNNDPQSKIAVGAEELVPIFTFVLIKSKLKNPNAEAAFMSEFMTEQMCINEEGYSVATLMTCIDFVDQLTGLDLEPPKNP